MICKYKKSNMLFGLIVEILIVMSLVLILCLILTNKFGKPSQKSIINQYYQNEQLFIDAQSELQAIAESVQDIHVYNRNKYISIEIYEHDGDKVNIIKVSDEYFEAYQNSINLVKLLNMAGIYREYSNTIFRFSFGQAIIEINNENELLRSYHILKKIHIKDNWYYVQIKT